jgi:hypothetical protein
MTDTATPEVEVEEPKRVVEDLEHFKEVRRGFKTDLYVGEFIPFTPADFVWSVTEVWEQSRQASSTLQGTPTEQTLKHLRLLAEVEERYGNRGKLVDMDALPLARRYLKVEWNHKGCRNDAQKDKRKETALAQLETARQLALRSASKVRQIEACERFNATISGVIERANRFYLETWTEAVVKGSHRDGWVLGERNETRRGEEVAAYRAAAEREAKLAGAVKALRDLLTQARNESHSRYQALALGRLQDDNWEDNDGKTMPTELSDRISDALRTSTRDDGRFPHFD